MSTPSEITPALHAGAAIYNDGQYHDAHDAWESVWLELDSGTDRDLLQGLIQFTGAIYHGTDKNWKGTSGLASSALTYLDGLSATHRGVDLKPLRSYLDALASAPERIEDTDPPPIRIDDTIVTYDGLSFDAIAIAVRIVCTDTDDALLEQAIQFGKNDRDDGRPTSPFITLVIDLLVRDQPAVVQQRLSEHVRRRRSKADDVKNLFE
ncbi:DUF309 domain-containing protein [Halocatena halophila]|uniref:DUF309 domain-containing protein n=1 Tax=Halocatena halophila TaxID=2814576 RepID=UPI002ED402E7